jgi:hypothetical protein
VLTTNIFSASTVANIITMTTAEKQKGPGFHRGLKLVGQLLSTHSQFNTPSKTDVATINLFKGPQCCDHTKAHVDDCVHDNLHFESDCEVNCDCELDGDLWMKAQRRCGCDVNTGQCYC